MNKENTVQETNKPMAYDALLPTVFTVWDAAFYDSKSRMFPNDEEVYGRFTAVDENDLKKQLKDKGYEPDKCRWEYDGQFD